MNTNIFNKKTSYFFGSLSKIGYVMIAVGIFVIASPFIIDDSNSFLKSLLVGSFTSLFGMILSFTYEGIIFDFNKKIFRKYSSFIGLKFGTWQAFPDFKVLRINSATFQATMVSNAVNPTFSGKVTTYKVGLFINYDNINPTIMWESEDKKRVIKDGLFLSEKLKIEFDNKIVIN